MGIYAYILKHVPKDRPGLPPEGLAVPGMPARVLGSPFAPGGGEHRMLYAQKRPRPDPKARSERIQEIVDVVQLVSGMREPSEETVRRLETALSVDNPLELVDEVMDTVSSLSIEDWEPLYDALSGIALSTEHPGVLKLAMALLGPFQEEETVPFYRILARHPEFSLYATTALANDPSPSARAALLQLLDETVGWAKVDVVERLLRVEELELGEVLLTKAMDAVEPVGGYIALGVADRCDLAGALEARGLTRDTLVGACRVLAQLASDAVERPEGIPGTLDDYEDADRAIDAFRERLPGGPADMDMAETAAALAEWARRRKKRDVEEDARAYLERPDVLGAVIDEITHRDPLRRARAATLAGRAGLDEALGTLMEVLERHPDEDAVAVAAVRLATGTVLAGLRDRIAARVDPESRTGEKATDHALEPSSRWIWQWVALLQALPRLPDEASRALLRTATRDRDPSARRAAIHALRAIGSEDPRDVEALRAAADDPVADIAAEAIPEAVAAVPEDAPSGPGRRGQPVSRTPGDAAGKRTAKPAGKPASKAPARPAAKPRGKNGGNDRAKAGAKAGKKKKARPNPGKPPRGRKG